MGSVGLRASPAAAGSLAVPSPGLDLDDLVLAVPRGPRAAPELAARVGVKVLVSIPVQNEARRLEESIEALDEAFGATRFDYHLSIAEDGSTDGTKEMLRRLPDRWPRILIQEEPHSMGRGKALRQLWSNVPADVYCFTDADLAAGPSLLVQAVEKVATGAPVVTGSRYAPGASTSRPPVRSLVSQAYNLLLRRSFGERIHDHQCGLKAFSAEVIRDVLPLTREDSWFWDTEMLVLALARGFPVTELPVTWVERKSSRTEYSRLLSDILLHGAGMLRLKSRVREIRLAGSFPDPARDLLGPPVLPWEPGGGLRPTGAPTPALSHANDEPK